MRRPAILVSCLCAALALDAAAKKPVKKKPKQASGDALAKAVFVGELFPSGNLYLYSLTEKQAKWPQEISYFVVDQSETPTPTINKAQLDTVVKATKLNVLEDGKSTALIATNTVGDFVRYKAERAPRLVAVVIAVAGFEIDRVMTSSGDEPRLPSEAERRAAEKWYEDWKREYRRTYGEAYDPENDEIFGRPETLVDAKVIATFNVKSLTTSVRVSRWSSRSAAQDGYAWFVIDVLLDGKVLKSVKRGILTGPLG